MSERSHSTPAWRFAVSGKKAALALGVAAALLGGALVYVSLPPVTASAQTGGQQQAAGTSRSQAGAPSATRSTRRSSAPPSSGLVAKVNGQPVSYSELAEACIRKHGEKVLDELINRRIIEQECAKRRITISPAEIEADIQASAKRAGMPSEALLKSWEDNQGCDRETLFKDVIWPKLALTKLAGAGVDVSEKELQESFEANYGVRVKARMIMCNDRRRAFEAWEQANRAVEQGHPEEFTRLVREYSTDPASRPLDGRIQPIHRFSGVPAIEEAAFKLRDGQLSPVIEVGSYFVILLCEGRTDPVDVTMAEVRDMLREDIYRKKVEQAALSVFAELKAQSAIENFMTGETKDRVAAKPRTPRRSPVQAASAQQPTSAPPRQARSAPANRKR